MRSLRIPHFPPQGICGISVTFATLSPISGYVPIYYSPVRHSPPGLLPCCRSTCMCKACRQRSIWARIKLFSSIPMLQFFNLPFYGQTDLTQSELIFLFLQLRVSTTFVSWVVDHSGFILNNSTLKNTYPHSSVVCKILKNWVAMATRGAHYTDQLYFVNLYFFSEPKLQTLALLTFRCSSRRGRIIAAQLMPSILFWNYHELFVKYFLKLT